MPNFIDIHSHILPGIDDGAENMAMTIDMLKIAEEEGITTIIATPHYIPGVGYFKKEKQLEAYNKVLEYIREKALPIELLIGNEIYLDDMTTEKILIKACNSIAGTQYVMLELPMSDQPKNLSFILSQITKADYYLILAHPERYPWLMEDEEMLKELIGQNCIMQINTGSITGLYGKQVQKAVKNMFLNNHVHIIGTDAHTNRRRAPKMKEAYDMVNQWVGQPQTDNIFIENPKMILMNTSPKTVLNHQEYIYMSNYTPNDPPKIQTLFMRLLTRQP